MIIVNCEQGSHEWFSARLGKPSASRISAVITSKGKPTASAARRTYALELVAERITERITEHYVSAAMERGKELEAQARVWYEITHAPVQQVGFCVADGGLTGCSPDGLVGDDGGIEVKCPMMPNYLDILESGEIPADWLLQIHHSMFVTGRAWWDFVLYTDVEPFGGWVKRVHRDEDMMAAMKSAVDGFAVEVDELTARVKAAMKG